ncbi:MAG: hypothetical protein WB867_05480, partial [Candidatus Dormiibacterota bacterium]
MGQEIGHLLWSFGDQAMAGTRKYFGSHVRHLTGSAEHGGRRSEDRIAVPHCDEHRYGNTPELGSRKRQRWAQLRP